MKLYELLESKMTYNGVVKTEQELINIVSKRGNSIQDIENPSEAVKLAAVKNFGSSIIWINNPSTEVLNTALTDHDWILYGLFTYKEFVKDYFKNNSLLMNKWLRYAENIREQEL